jgi:metal-responsive CopG/Arc/MetJ family transcriptional regulator
MRVHIDMDEALIKRIDAVAGERGRSNFVRDAVVAALDQQQRARMILSARGGISAKGHDWDADAAAWVRTQRRGDQRRLG